MPGCAPRSLWMSIGLHAGVVFVKMSFAVLSKRRETHLPWIGRELQIGLVPVGILLLAWSPWCSPPPMRIADALRLTGEALLNALVSAALREVPGGDGPGEAPLPGLRGPGGENRGSLLPAMLPTFRWRDRGRVRPAASAGTGSCISIARWRAIAAAGWVREFIHRFKYERHFYLRRPLADWLAETLEDERIATRPFDALVPVPLHAAR